MRDGREAETPIDHKVNACRDYYSTPPEGFSVDRKSAFRCKALHVAELHTDPFIVQRL